MQFRLTIDMDNATFDECPGDELTRIFKTISKRIEDATYSELLDADRASTTVRDTNGNTVGNWIVQTLDDVRANPHGKASWSARESYEDRLDDLGESPDF